ncbi:hypothetical protein Echvi_0861 [Echinicola vietnamensis DSM 17526]|uniref:Uncharacterized protein n=1 Tax=Echinicola vietnamensis (strain DSM 17526 / LMG 23754 / KMM 6221) TaxID=926556 RepID=L0FTA2_ECHVK|nr:hypothetical protein Echvi_0861 [Echinicola vietnamensis DSM 17526]
MVTLFGFYKGLLLFLSPLDNPINVRKSIQIISFFHETSKAVLNAYKRER